MHHLESKAVPGILPTTLGGIRSVAKWGTPKQNGRRAEPPFGRIRHDDRCTLLVPD